MHRLFLRVTKERQPCQAFLILRTPDSQTRFIPRKNETRRAAFAVKAWPVLCQANELGLNSVGRTKRSAVPAGRPIAGTALRLVRPTPKSSLDSAPAWSRGRQFVKTHGNRRQFDAITGGNGNTVLLIDVAESLMPDAKIVLADWLIIDLELAVLVRQSRIRMIDDHQS